jgi:branched-chain amino acid transport system substrate-binding protein
MDISTEGGSRMFWRLLAVLFALSLIAAACGSDDTADDDASASATDDTEADEASEGDSSEEADGAASADGEPIKIGDVTSTSGAAIFPESATIAKLVFERYNEQGGVDGRPIELVSVDAQDTSEGAAAAAKQLLEEEEVLGFCCGGSIVDCTTNASYYEQNNVEALMGVAACAEAATVHPINTGPFVPTLHMLDFFVYNLGHENICFTGYNVGLTPIFQDVFLPLWEADSGITVNQAIPEVGEDLTPTVAKLAADGCDAVLAGFTEPDYQSFFQIVDGQGLREEIDFGMLTSGYSLSLLAAAGGTLEGIYANSEFEPYTGDPSTFSDEVNDYIALTTEADEALTSFGEGGYISANIMIEALESIEGEITFESVQEAIKNIEYETPMLGGPFTATGFVGPVQPNPYSQIMQVQDGEFTSVTGWWLFPRAEDERNAETLTNVSG